MRSTHAELRPRRIFKLSPVQMVRSAKLVTIDVSLVPNRVKTDSATALALSTGPCFVSIG